ncbi:hypothetical protein [Kitasatospora sp. HPMI-4]|uniref:hypothetical protein n=1 Tax=Kitasatospora sp. HPMI-4 TaxID=3448443 RepID=UPI003F1B6ECB
MSLVDQLKADLTSAHAGAQLGRFLRLGVVAFGAQLATLGADHLGRDALIGAAVGAVEAAYRQWAPVVPWAEMAQRLHVLDAIRSVPAPVAPPVPPAAPTAPGGGGAGA